MVVRDFVYFFAAAPTFVVIYPKFATYGFKVVELEIIFIEKPIFIWF